jgi:hypothetical protein
MIASNYRPIVLPYRLFDVRQCDLRHRLTYFSADQLGGSDGLKARFSFTTFKARFSGRWGVPSTQSHTPRKISKRLQA